MKQWLSIFSAVLVAGFVIFGVFKYDQLRDRKIATWNASILKLSEQLNRSVAHFELGDNHATGSAEDIGSMRWSLKQAESFIAHAPSGVDTSSISQEIARAKAAAAKP